MVSAEFYGFVPFPPAGAPPALLRGAAGYFYDALRPWGHRLRLGRGHDTGSLERSRFLDLL